MVQREHGLHLDDSIKKARPMVLTDSFVLTNDSIK